MPTIAIFAPELSGETGFTLYLYGQSDGVLLNSGGDSLSESPSDSGRFVATVSESIGSLHNAVVEDSIGPVRDGWLPAGETVVRDAYPTDVNVSGYDSGQSPKEQVIEWAETDSRAKGGVSILNTLELVAAGVVGVSSAPAAGTEKFQYLDGTDAFTTTFNTNDYRQSVSLH